jgi:hypothetical protein
VEIDDAVVAALGVPGVVGLHAGVLGTATTYLPGRSVAGISLRDHGTEVHLVVTADADLRGVAAGVHAALERVGAPRPVRVHIGALRA